ncbi:hypothetical protein PENSPDRAFT_738252 [Peniophora sp. CONT]|nr:hypothetical protein PENSPDRAFT_738252 [Peniophora sp. CONT]
MSDAAAAAVPQSLLTTVKLLHVFGGIYIWEWVTTLGFEWEVYTGKRDFRWSFCVYVVCRLFALAAIILAFIGFNVTTEINCDAWLRSLLLFAWFGIGFSSLLILLRGIALWAVDWKIVTVMSAAWLTTFGFSLYSIQQGHTEWSPVIKACMITDTYKYKWGLLVNLLVELLLLGIMFAGVLSKRNGTGLWRVLFIQGIIWMLVAGFSKLPSVILSFLNMDDGWNLMFQFPHLVIIITIATRVYRELVDYISPLGATASRLKPMQPRANSEAAMQVTVHKTVDIEIDVGAHRAASQLVGRSRFVQGEYVESREHIISRGEREAKDMLYTSL